MPAEGTHSAEDFDPGPVPGETDPDSYRVPDLDVEDQADETDPNLTPRFVLTLSDGSTVEHPNAVPSHYDGKRVIRADPL